MDMGWALVRLCSRSAGSQMSPSEDDFTEILLGWQNFEKNSGWKFISILYIVT